MAKNWHLRFFAAISIVCFSILCSCGQQTEIVPAPSKTYTIANAADPVSDADLVFEAYDVLQRKFYNPAALSYVNLFNAALKGVSEELNGKDIKYDF